MSNKDYYELSDSNTYLYSFFGIFAYSEFRIIYFWDDANEKLWELDDFYDF